MTALTGGLNTKRVYLSGPMRSKPDHNYSTFVVVEEALIETYPGVAALNPARNFGGDQTLEPAKYMEADLAQILSADVLVLLPGWESSEGAKLEVAVAKSTGKSFYEARPVDDGHRISWTFVELSEPAAGQSARGGVLDEAKSLITGDRNNAYGPPTQDFRRSADALTAYGYRHTQLAASDPPCSTCGATALQAHDTAIAIDCVKTSRLMWTPGRRDSWVDKAGYAACGYEAATAA